MSTKLLNLYVYEDERSQLSSEIQDLRELIIFFSEKYFFSENIKGELSRFGHSLYFPFLKFA